MSQSAPWVFDLPARYVSEDGIDGLVNGISPLVRDFLRNVAGYAQIEGAPLRSLSQDGKPVAVALDSDKLFDGGSGGDHEPMGNGLPKFGINIKSNGHKRMSFVLRRVTLP